MIEILLMVLFVVPLPEGGAAELVMTHSEPFPSIEACQAAAPAIVGLTQLHLILEGRSGGRVVAWACVADGPSGEPA